jgi:predicted GNAT family N-acyltransferase
MIVRVIDHGSKFYSQMVELRTEVLRKPLGLEYTAEQLAAEKNDILIGAFNFNSLIGCCILTELTQHQIQLRQMAVIPMLHGQGIGTKIINFAENFAIENHFKILLLHARETAMGFYEKLGYQAVGEPYLEVNLPHITMEKKLKKA